VSARSAPSPDAAVNVIVGTLPGELGRGRYLLIGPRGTGGPFRLGAPVIQPAVEFIDDSHPVMRHVIFNDVLIEQASTLSLPPSANTLVRSIKTPLVFAQNDGAHRIVGLNFDVDPVNTNLPLRVGFQVLLYNAIDWLVQTAGGEEEDPLDLPADRPLVVTGPDGVRRLDPQPARRLDPQQPGFYEIASGSDRLKRVGVSVLSTEETEISPRAEITAAPASRVGRLRDRDLSSTFLLLALLVLCLEWLTYHRRITV
jgi:hypothetical protein